MQELGLRDAAVFEAWVDMPQVPEVAPEEEAEEDVFPRVTALPSFKERTYPRETAVLTSKDLERAARVHEPDEITYDYQGEILEDGSEVCPLCDTLQLQRWPPSHMHRLQQAVTSDARAPQGCARQHGLSHTAVGVSINFTDCSIS